ncbi:DUF4232 domain-containing protein [Streptomyces sp. NPDC005017]|uniref:DUF4232 domain-containing protein n=1 Tax=Streptomyces sp. NPDC005017 TaxID=3364706 RepID=UPI0036759BE9
MRRPTLSLVAAALLLAGATACSSSSDSGDGPGGAGTGANASRADGNGGAASGSEDPNGPNGEDGRNGPDDPDGQSGQSGRSGRSGEDGASGGSPGGGGPSSPPPGVLYGADRLPTPAADRCRTKDLSAVARSTGQGRASVVLTNEGDGSCTLRGFPSLLFVGEAGRAELPVDWDGSAANAEEVTLTPGDSASAGLTFVGLDECEPVGALDVVPPGESRPLTPGFTTAGGARAEVRICDTGVKVTAFAPAP